MAEISLRDFFARRGYSCRDSHWSRRLPVGELASTKRAGLVCVPDAVGHVVELLDVHAGLQPCDGLVPGVCGRARTGARSAVAVPVGDADFVSIRPFAVASRLARTLQLRGLAFPDVRVCVQVS